MSSFSQQSIIDVKEHIFTTSGTYTKSSGVKKIEVICTGGGGCGYIHSTTLFDGGNSTFGSYLTGNGGTKGQGGTNSDNFFTSHGKGGTASGGDFNIQGGFGKVVETCTFYPNYYFGFGGDSYHGGGSIYGKTPLSSLNYGAGGCCYNQNTGAGGWIGGGAGGTAIKTFYPHEITESVICTIGAGGYTGQTAKGLGGQGVIIIREYI